MKNDKPDECLFCGHGTKKLTKYKRQEDSEADEDAWLCDVCANTIPGTAWDFPSRWDEENLSIMKHISQCTNITLEAIRESKK